MDAPVSLTPAQPFPLWISALSLPYPFKLYHCLLSAFQISPDNHPEEDGKTFPPHVVSGIVFFATFTSCWSTEIKIYIQLSVKLLYDDVSCHLFGIQVKLNQIHMFLFITDTHMLQTGSRNRPPPIGCQIWKFHPDIYRAGKIITRSLERGQTDRQAGRLTGDTLTRWSWETQTYTPSEWWWDESSNHL